LGDDPYFYSIILRVFKPMELILKLAALFALSFFELWIAIPAGFVLQLHPILIAGFSALGAITGVLIVIILGQKIRSWFMKRYERKREKKTPGLIYKIWDQYGVIGLGLLAPLITGTLLGTGIGLAFGVSNRRLFLWFSIGSIGWCVGLTIAGMIGFAELKALWK
jgi:hypothetical protein